MNVYLTVPICLNCWLIELAAIYHFFGIRGRRNDLPLDEASPFTGWGSRRWLQRMRCKGCGRPMRLAGTYATGPSPLLSLRRRSCCEDCLHKATLRRANERRRVRHEKRKCVVCKKLFMPTQSSAQTCSNTCRQRLFRQNRKRAKAAAKRKRR
jgi:hypothetical protein